MRAQIMASAHVDREKVETRVSEGRNLGPSLIVFAVLNVKCYRSYFLLSSNLDPQSVYPAGVFCGLLQSVQANGGG
jgi:hypothetical protein